MSAAIHPLDIAQQPVVGELDGAVDVDMEAGKDEEWQCKACKRNATTIKRRGHANNCRALARALKAAPRQYREHAVMEWPGLVAAIKGNQVLRANLIAEIVRCYEADAERLQRAGRPHTEPVDKLCTALGKLSETMTKQHRIVAIVGAEVRSGMYRR